MNKKLKKALNWTVAIVGIIGTLYFTSAKHDDLHETHLNGEETIGIVVKRSTGRSVKPGTGIQKWIMYSIKMGNGFKELTTAESIMKKQ